jgi:hypothetical protein
MSKHSLIYSVTKVELLSSQLAFMDEERKDNVDEGVDGEGVDGYGGQYFEDDDGDVGDIHHAHVAVVGPIQQPQHVSIHISTRGKPMLRLDDN